MVQGGAGWCQPLLVLKPRASLLANFSETTEQKQTPLKQLAALLGIRIILKNEHNRYFLQGVIAIILYRTKCPKKRGDSYSEPKLTISTT